MPKTSLGKGYVQIVPTTEGLSGAIAKELGGAGASNGTGFGSKFVSFAKKAIVAGGIAKFMTSAIKEGARYEQAVGGIETLFKGSEDRMIAYANQAWKTAGISANDYMEQATSFAASLLQSLNGDTAAAGEAANQAVIDMSDNVNKFGSNIADVQHAYQGFAKQNYTMLDNLKLGYGGTKTEMERLLKDAEEISGIHYDINNLSDVYSAIHVIQTELGVTGTTAAEASTTLSGSFASMKSAVSNFMAQLVMGEDLSAAMDGVLESAITFGKNVLKALGNILLNLPDTLGHLGDTLIQKIQAMGNDPSVGEAAGEFIKSFALGLIKNLPKLAGAVLSLLGYLANQLGAAVATIGKSIGSKIISAITGPFNTAKDKVKAIIDKIKGFFNFKVGTPHIPVPKFTITPSGWKVGDLLKGKIPKLSVAWHAEGGIFTKPTILNGYGEAGPEAALPLDPFWDRLDRWGQSIVGAQREPITVILQVDGKEIARTTAPYMRPELNKLDTRSNRKLGYI